MEKRCNHCGEIIETFGPGSPLAQYMYLDLGLRSTSDTSKLVFGLEPYHWHNTSRQNCLSPASSSMRRFPTIMLHPSPSEIAQKDAEERTAPPPPPPTVTTQTTKGEKHYAPYRDNKINDSSSRVYEHHLRKYEKRGRPPKTINYIQQQQQQQKEKEEDESKDSV